jgi:hypothetical protein
MLQLIRYMRTLEGASPMGDEQMSKVRYNHEDLMSGCLHESTGTVCKLEAGGTTSLILFSCTVLYIAVLNFFGLSTLSAHFHRSTLTSHVIIQVSPIAQSAFFNLAQCVSFASVYGRMCVGALWRLDYYIQGGAIPKTV